MNTGGPAFPVSEDAARFPGMSMRDYLAAKAMQTLLMQWVNQDLAMDNEGAGHLAREAYLVADAMLAVRGKP